MVRIVVRIEVRIAVDGDVLTRHLHPSGPSFSFSSTAVPEYGFSNLRVSTKADELAFRKQQGARRKGAGTIEDSYQVSE